MNEETSNRPATEPSTSICLSESTKAPNIAYPLQMISTPLLDQQQQTSESEKLRSLSNGKVDVSNYHQITGKSGYNSAGLSWIPNKNKSKTNESETESRTDRDQVTQKEKSTIIEGKLESQSFDKLGLSILERISLQIPVTENDALTEAPVDISVCLMTNQASTQLPAVTENEIDFSQLISEESTVKSEESKASKRVTAVKQESSEYLLNRPTWDEDQYDCFECDLVFLRKYQLLAHWRKNHKPAKYRAKKQKKECRVVEYVNSKGQITGVRRVVPRADEDLKACDICGQSFEYRLRLRKHLTVHEAWDANAPEEKPVYDGDVPFLIERRCPECNQPFYSLKMLHQHQFETHSNAIKAPSERVKFKVKKAIDMMKQRARMSRAICAKEKLYGRKIGATNSLKKFGVDLKRSRFAPIFQIGVYNPALDGKHMSFNCVDCKNSFEYQWELSAHKMLAHLKWKLATVLTQVLQLENVERHKGSLAKVKEFKQVIIDLKKRQDSEETTSLLRNRNRPTQWKPLNRSSLSALPNREKLISTESPGFRNDHHDLVESGLPNGFRIKQDTFRNDSSRSGFAPMNKSEKPVPGIKMLPPPRKFLINRINDKIRTIPKDHDSTAKKSNSPPKIGRPIGKSNTSTLFADETISVPIDITNFPDKKKEPTSIVRPTSRWLAMNKGRNSFPIPQTANSASPTGNTMISMKSGDSAVGGSTAIQRQDVPSRPVATHSLSKTANGEKPQRYERTANEKMITISGIVARPQQKTSQPSSSFQSSSLQQKELFQETVKRPMPQNPIQKTNSVSISNAKGPSMKILRIQKPPKQRTER